MSHKFILAWLAMNLMLLSLSNAVNTEDIKSSVAETFGLQSGGFAAPGFCNLVDTTIASDVATTMTVAMTMAIPDLLFSSWTSCSGVMSKHEITTAAHNYFASSKFFASISRIRKLYELRLVSGSCVDVGARV